MLMLIWYTINVTINEIKSISFYSGHKPLNVNAITLTERNTNKPNGKGPQILISSDLCVLSAKGMNTFLIENKCSTCTLTLEESYIENSAFDCTLQARL